MKRSSQALFIASGIFFSGLAVLIANPRETAPKAPETDPVTASSVSQDAPAPPYTGESPDGPAIEANAAYAALYDGTTLYAENESQAWPLASLTKLMTAVVALENLPQSAERDSLIRRMMVISDNTAADTLANTLGTDAWVALMGKTAERLNMKRTGFSDPSGLSYLNQSTVGDIYRLASYAFGKHPEIFAWSLAPSVEMEGKKYPNINEFAGREGYLGGKTGFTDEANANLLSAWQTARGPLFMIVLGTKDKTERFTQTEKLRTWLSQRFKLYEY